MARLETAIYMAAGAVALLLVYLAVEAVIIWF